MDSILQLIVTQGAGVTALAIVFYQYYTMPKKFEINRKIIVDLKKVIEENGKTMLAVVKILNNIQKSLQTINDCSKEMKTSLTKIEIYSEEKSR